MIRNRARSLCLSLAFVVAAAGISVAAAPTALAAATYPACATQVPSSPVGSTGGSATGYVMNVGNLATVWDPPGNNYGQAPNAFGYDTGTAAAPSRSVVVTMSENADTSNAPIEGGRVLSTDGGNTFPASSYQHQSTIAPPGGFAVRLRSGTLYSVDFRPLSNTTSTATVATWTSTNNGASWTQGQMTFTAPTGKQLNWIRMDEQPIELADGTIVASYYASYAGDPNTNAELMQSTDGGLHFTRRGVIAAATSTIGYNEAGIAQLPNGSLIAVVRTSIPGTSGPTKLVQATSSNGVTWTAPTDLLVSLGGAPASSYPGINPQLVLLPNGILALSSGRDNTGNGNNWVAISTNGAGTGWTGALTFRNCPQFENSNGSKWHGSSGNTGLTAVSSSTLMQATDNCHAGYCLFAGDSGFTTDNQYRIYRRMVDALTPDTGKIDLGGKLRAGTVSVSGNMTYGSSAHPRTGVAGAFDGSTEYWSSAVATGGAGSMVIALDKTYRMTKVGLSLRNGRQESARVSFSTNGSTWSSPAVSVTRTDYAIGYTTLATPTDAKYVKIDVDATGGCETGLGSSCAFLNEVELYSTTDSFENDPLINRPRGWSGLASCWVTTSYAGDSSRVLYCSDGSKTASATGSVVGSAAASKNVQFRIRPIGLNGAALFNVLGKNASGTQVDAFHFGVFPDGSVRRWTGSAWITVVPAGTAAIGSWSTITVAASTTSATLTVNGTSVSALPPTTAASTLVGFGVSSGGLMPDADYFAIDDVTVS